MGLFKVVYVFFVCATLLGLAMSQPRPQLDHREQFVRNLTRTFGNMTQEQYYRSVVGKPVSLYPLLFGGLFLDHLLGEENRNSTMESFIVKTIARTIPSMGILPIAVDVATDLYIMWDIYKGNFLNGTHTE